MILIMKCKRGHKVEVGTAEEARRLHGTACIKCWRPLFLTRVRSAKNTYRL